MPTSTRARRSRLTCSRLFCAMACSWSRMSCCSTRVSSGTSCARCRTARARARPTPRVARAVDTARRRAVRVGPTDKRVTARGESACKSAERPTGSEADGDVLAVVSGVLFARVATRGEVHTGRRFGPGPTPVCPPGETPGLRRDASAPGARRNLQPRRFNATPSFPTVLGTAPRHSGCRAALRHCQLGPVARWPRLLALIGELLAGPSPTPRAARGGRDFSSSPARL